MVGIIQAGEFGEEAKDAILDADRWWRIYDDLIDVPRQEVIERDSLRVLEFPGRLDVGEEHRGIGIIDGPTTGPQPRSWQAVVTHDATQSASTYVFRFGSRDLWKIGHAVDVDARLAEVNRHVPHEVLGEAWTLVLYHPWPNRDMAYEMEQQLLHLLRGPTSIGERVACPRRSLDEAWTALTTGNTER